MANKFEEYVLDKLDNFEEKFKQNDKFQADVYERFDKSDARMDIFEQDMCEMKADISNLKEDVATLKTDVATLKTDVSILKKDMALMKEDMSFMQRTMLSMQKTIETMNRSIILIEHKITTEIPALFDGYSMHQQNQEIQQENLTSLNVKVEEHDIRISSLENTIF